MSMTSSVHFFAHCFVAVFSHGLGHTQCTPEHCVSSFFYDHYLSRYLPWILLLFSSFASFGSATYLAHCACLTRGLSEVVVVTISSGEFAVISRINHRTTVYNLLDLCSFCNPILSTITLCT